jgi:MSHA pilin protein MshD
MTRQRGLSLIELLVFIVVVGIAVTGVLSVYSLTSRTSVDPMIRKQAAAIAESLLEEVLGQSYTYCYPNDANVTTATSAAGCATPPVWPQPGTSRYSATAPYDSVLDYNGFTMPSPPGIRDFTGSTITGLGGYSASVQVQPAGAFNGIPAGETLLVTVTVTGPGNFQVSLSGYRTRYAPNL